MRNSARQTWRWSVPNIGNIESFQAHSSCRFRGRLRIMSPASRIGSSRNFLVGVPGWYMKGRGDNARTRCTPPGCGGGTKTNWRPPLQQRLPTHPGAPKPHRRHCDFARGERRERRGSRQPLATSTLLAPTARCDDLELLSGACNPITARALPSTISRSAVNAVRHTTTSTLHSGHTHNLPRQPAHHGVVTVARVPEAARPVSQGLAQRC